MRPTSPPTSYHIMNTKANHDTNGVNNGLLYVIRFFEGGPGQNVYLMGTIHRTKCTHCHLEITSTMPRCFLVTSTMSRHIEKNETRNKNPAFHMKRKKNRALKREQKIAHLIWAKKVSFETLRGAQTGEDAPSGHRHGKQNTLGALTTEQAPGGHRRRTHKTPNAHIGEQTPSGPGHRAQENVGRAHR